MKSQRMTAEDRKLAIVKAAFPLFANDGFAETTTKDLAKAAGISEPLLYKHFPSKEALYLEIQNYCCSGTEAVARKLADLKPSTATLVHLVYFLMRALVLGRPSGTMTWPIRHRLMLQSLLADGAFARLLYQRCFETFCARIIGCIEAAIMAGDAVETPVHKSNLACFAHHMGAWVASAHLPSQPVLDYGVPPEELLNQAVWFALRGMGLTDKAIATYYNPKALSSAFAES